MASGDPDLSPSRVSAMLPQQLSIPSFIDKPEDNDDNDISEDKSEGLISQLAFLEESEDKKVEADKTDEDKSISEYSDTEGSVGSDEDVDEDDADEDDDEEEDEEDDDDDEEDNEGDEGNENTNSGGDAEMGEDDEVEMQVNDIIQKLDMEDDNIIETKDFDDLTDDSKPSTSLFDFTPMTAEKPPESSESKPAESTAKKPKKTRKRKRKLTKEEKAERKAKRKKTVPKPLFKRRNIRQIKTEKDLDATTLAAQNEELERQRRLMEQKKAVLNKAPFHVSASGIKQENKDCQLKSLLQAVEEDAEKAAKEDMEKLEKEAKIKKELEEKEEKKKPPEVIDISSTDEEEERDDDSDVVMVQSDEEEDDELDEDDPNNGGSHIDDSLNQKDEQGRVIVNVGHPAEDPDIFLSPKVADNIKPHQIGGVRFLYDNLVESISRYKSSVGFGCILAHSMGLGKTIQMIGFVDIFLRYTPAKTVLCIVPINTLQNWNSEFNMWLPPEGPAEDSEARHFKVFLLNDNLKTTKARAKVIDGWTKEGGVLLMGYEMYRLLASKRSFPAKPKKTKKPAEPEVIDVDEEDNNKVLMSDMHGALVNPGPDLVICDEGHRIKNNAAGISQQLKNIKTKRRVVLTGYPLQNNLLEYWCMVDFVRPNFLGTKTEFCNMFERPITNGQCQDSTKDDVRVMRYRAYVLHSLLEGFVQRRGHTVLRAALPPKQEFVFLLRMSPIQKKLYSHFMKAINETNMAAFESNNPLKAFAVCCKIWNHPDVLYKLLTGLKKGVDNDLDIETEGTTTKKKSSSKSSKSSGKNSSSPKSAAAAAATSSASASSSSTSVTSSSAAPGGMRGNPADVYNFPGTGGDSGGGLPSSGLMPGMMGGSMSWAPTGTTLSSASGSGMVGPMSGMQGNMMGMGPMQGNMMGMGPMQGGAMGPLSGGLGQMNLQSNSGGLGQGLPNSGMGQNMPGGMGQMQGNMGSGNMGQGMPGNSMGQMQGSMPNMGPGMSSNNMGQMQGSMSSPGMGQNMPNMNMGQMQGSMGGSNMGQGMAGGMGQMQGSMANGMSQMQGSMSGNSMGQMKGGMGSGSMGPMQSNMPGSAMGQMQGNIPSNVMGPMQGSISNSLMGQMHGMSNNMGQNMPGTNMGQNMPGSMGQNMSGSSMGQNMAGNNMGQSMSGNMGQNMPGNNMGQNMPGNMGQNMPGNNMGQNMSGNNMGQNMSGNLGQNMSGNMGQNMPGNNMGQNMPGNNMGQNMPGNMGQNMPGNGMGQNMPGNGMGQNMPGNGMGQSMPGNNMGQNMPGNMGQNMSGSNMGQNMSGSNMGQNMSGNNMGQNMSGNNMGQNMPGNNMGPMQGNMGPMPGNLGDSMNSGGSQMCDPMTGMPFGSMFGGMGAFPAGGFLGDLNSDSMGDPMGVSLGDQMAGSPASHSRQLTGSLGSGAGSGMAGSVGGNSSGPSGNMTHPMGGGNGSSMGRDAGMTGGTMDASSLGEMTGNAFRSSPGQMAGNSFGQSAGPPPDHFGNVTGFGVGQQGSDLPGVGGSMVGTEGSSGQGYTTVTTSGSTMGTGTLTDSLVNTSTTVTCSASETGAGVEPSKESSGQATAGPASGDMQPKAETSTTSSTGTCVSSSSSSTSTATAMEVDAGSAAESKTSESSTGTDANSGSASTSTAASTGSSSTSTTTTSTASGNIPGPVGEALAAQDKKGENSISYEWAEELMKDYIPGIVENSGKMVLLLQLVEETVRIGDKILVFSQSLTTLNVIEEFLGMFDVPRPDMNEKWCRNKNYFRLDGSTSGTERERLINQFNDPDNNRFWLFLLSTRAGCLGINLVGANRVVVVDASWNPCHDCQAICRVYRFGQEKPSYIYRLVTDNSLEKKIYDRQVNKQGMSDRVIDELNPDTQFQRRKLDNLLEYEEKEEVPEIDFTDHVGEFEDPVLYKVLQTKGSWLTKNPFTHESLLIDRKEMRLTKKDKRLAKENYARDKKMNTTYARQSYAAFYPRNNMGQPQSAGVSFRTVTVNRPVASVKPMICTPVTSRKTMPVFNSNLRPGVSVHQVITTTATETTTHGNSGKMRIPHAGRPRTCPSYEITLPGSNSTTEAGSVSKIPAGQRVLVIKTPKGIYIRTVDGKLFAVRSKEGTLPAGLPGVTGAAASTATTLSASQSPGTIRIVTCPPGGLKKDGKDLPRIVIKDASGTGGGSVISTDLLSSIYSQTKTVNAIIQGQDPKTGAKTLIIPRTKTSTDTKDSKTAEAGTSTEVKKEGGGETKIITSASPQMLKLVSSGGQPIMARTLPSSVLSLLAGKEGLPKGATAVVISRGDLGKKGSVGSKDLLSLLGKNTMLKLATSATTSTTNATPTPAVSPSALGKGINLSLKSLAAGSPKDTKKIAPKTSIVQMGNNKVLILEKPNATSTKTSKTSSGASPTQAGAGEKVSKGIGADLDSSSSAAEASSGEEEGKKLRAEEGRSAAPSAEGTKASSSLSQTQSPQSTPVAGKQQQQQQGAKDGGASLSKEDSRQALPVSKATAAASQSAGSQTPSQRPPGGEKATSKSVAPSPSTQTPLAGLASLAVPATGSASAGKSSSSRSTANTTTSRAATSSTTSSSANTTTPASTAATTASTTTSAPASVASSAAGTTGASSSSSTSQTPSSAAAELRSQQSGAGSMFPLPGQPFPDPMSQGAGPPHFPPSPMVGQNLPGFPGQALGSSHYPDSSHASQFGAFPHHGQNSFSSWPPFGQTPGFPQQLGSSLDLQSRPSFDHQPRAGSSVFDQQPSAAFDPQQPFGRQSSSSFDKPSGESAFQRHSQDSSSLFTRQGPSAFEQPSTTPAFPRGSSLFDRHPPQGFDKQPSSMFPDLSLDMGLGGPPVSSAAAAAGLGLDSKAFGPPGMSRSQLFDPFAPSYSPYSMGHSGYPMGAAQAGMGMGMQSSFPFMAPSLQSRGFGGLGEGSMFGDPTVGQSGSTVSPINNCGGTYQSASPYNLASPFQQSYYSRPYPGYQPFPSSPYMAHHLPPLMGQSPHPSQTPSALNPPTSHPPL